MFFIHVSCLPSAQIPLMPEMLVTLDADIELPIGMHKVRPGPVLHASHIALET